MEISQKSRTATALLAFFLGTFGIHRFYAGKTATGLAMLLIAITFIGAIVSAVWGFIDLIMVLCGSFTDGEGKKIVTW